MIWNYDLTPTSQGIDMYKRPSQLGPLISFTISNPSLYGYKIADSIPGISLVIPGITISNLHTFFDKMVTPRCYSAQAFADYVAGLALGANYIVPDAWYLFPLDYNDNDSTDFNLKFGAGAAFGMQQRGYRKTRVDGWGTITTPYFTTPAECIRVRSEITEVDSISLDSLSFGIPRTTIEYKWLVKGEHYPALWVTAISLGGLEVPLTMRYRDIYRPELNGGGTGVAGPVSSDKGIIAYPNPAKDGKLNFDLPAAWKDFYIEFFDVQGRLAGTFTNKRQVDIGHFPEGNYVARISTAGATSYIKIVR
jgi:hypothetical protein